MKSGPRAALLSSLPPPADALRRSRWPVFFCALILLWCAWWYCRGDSQGLLFLATALAALAVARPRALPGTARWVIWSGLLLTVACLAANVTRLVPPEGALDETQGIDRVSTVAFAMGLAGLFFRCTADGVTLAAAGGLPMAMVVLSRSADQPGAAKGFELLVAWGFIALVVAADLAQRLTQTRPAERGVAEVGAREMGLRLASLAVVLALAFGLRAPVEWAAKGLQKMLVGWVLYPEHTGRRRAGDLWLTRVTPLDLGQRMRAVLLVGAENVPGYLRESVYTTYRSGRWTAPKPESPLKEVSPALTGRQKASYALSPAESPPTSFVWRVEVMAPAHMTRFCLPGNAHTLTCDGLPPLADTNGTVSAKERLPETYDLAVMPRLLMESAYPFPGGRDDPAFLDIPPPLAGAVSNWVSACAGLAGAPTLAAAIRRVEDHFATNFTYRLGLRMKATPDPLVDFMARKEGSCTLFASAAALMFRSCGVPSRVIDGFVCSGWNPWLDRWVARERDGHAWVEVWDRASGRWLVADPTPPDGQPAALRKPGRVRLAFDLLLAGWKRALTYLRGANFLEVIADGGALLFLLLREVALSLPGAVALAGFTAVWWLRRRLRLRKLSPAERLRLELVGAMRGLERRAVAAHLRRRSFESWSAWLRRVGPELPAERREALQVWLEEYQALRYSATSDERETHAWIGRARAVKTAQHAPRGRQRRGSS